MTTYKHVEYLISGLKDTDGLPLDTGSVEFHSPSSQQDNTMRTSSDGSTTAYSATLDAFGRAKLWQNSARKVVVMDASGRVIKTLDDQSFLALQGPTSWTPNFGTAFSSSSLSYAFYYNLGSLCWWFISVTGTVTGTPNNLTFSLPGTELIKAGVHLMGSGRIKDAGGSAIAQVYKLEEQYAKILKFDAGNWTNGANCQVVVSGLYETEWGIWT